jgi:hypothetical protein
MPVPDIPLVDDIESLAPIPLRREIARAEGRASDLQKARAAELAGLEAAISDARAAAASADAADSANSGNADDARPDPLLDDNRHTERRRRIEQRYARVLADARQRLRRLLAFQARIDPDAPDQQRLRDAATGSAAGLSPNLR